MTRPKSRLSAAIALVAMVWAAVPARAAPVLAQAAASPVGLPPVPTTKILAIGHLTAAATPEAMRVTMSQEVRDTVGLYLAGKLDQWFVRQDRPGVVFILDVADADEARAMLARLPLGRAGLMDFDLIPLGPLAPLGLLLGPAAGRLPTATH